MTGRLVIPRKRSAVAESTGRSGSGNGGKIKENMKIPKTGIPHTAHNSFMNQIDFIIRSIISDIWTATAVRVEAVKERFVDIKPLVHMLDNAGDPVEHGIIYNVPYFTLQGGKNAVKITPQKGDIGIAVFAMRDISAVKAAKAAAAPATLRQYAPADAMYIGGILNQEATQYIEIADSEITVKSAGKVVIDAPNIELGANATDALLLSSKLIAAFNTHTHAGVTTGGGVSGAPSTPLAAAAVTSAGVKTK
jgi:hypothetical protein